MANKKSLYTVKQAVAIAFKALPDEFNSNSLIALVRELTSRPYLHDDTIKRRLRDLRFEKPSVYGYQVINHDRSIYLKNSF